MAKKTHAVETVDGNEKTVEKSRRRVMPWDKRPFAVIIGRSPRVRGCFDTVDEAVAFVSQLPVLEQSKAFIGQFFPVEVKTTVGIKK